MAQFADQLTNAPKSNFFTGSKGGFQNIPIFNQQQSGSFGNILQQAMQMLSGQGSNPSIQQSLNQFHTQTIPGLAERFTAMGNGQRSSAFEGALGSAAGNLHQGLQAQQFQQAFPLLQLGLTPQYQTAHIPGQQGFLQGIAGPALQAAIAGLTGGLGGAALGGWGNFGKGAGIGLLGGLGGGGNQQSGGGGIGDILKLLMAGG